MSESGRAAARARWGRRLRDPTLWALVLAALALAACFLPFEVNWQRSRFEHVIVLDVTQSMNVQDQRHDGRAVSRLAYAKHALQQALQELPCGSRIGWAIFTEYRSYLLFTPVEVCANRAELRSTLAAIDGRMAWSGNSEIAKGLHSGLMISKALSSKPSLVFVTDGHEAPPLQARNRPRFDDTPPGEVQGLIVGVGGSIPAPIPKTDPLGRAIGFWSADEVAQVDPRTLGRGGSVGGEKMVEPGFVPAPDAADAPGAAVAAGNEHLSSLREAYLRVLAADHGLAFHRLRGAAEFSAALRAPALARPLDVHGDLRVPLAALALVLLLAPYATAWWPRRHAATP